jgi:hypothetical protein
MTISKALAMNRAKTHLIKPERRNSAVWYWFCLLGSAIKHNKSYFMSALRLILLLAVIPVIAQVRWLWWRNRHAFRLAPGSNRLN